MSRSYKKHVRNKGKVSKYFKRLANKMVRRYKGELANGNAYKKVMCSYIIYDRNFYVSPKDSVYDDWKRK